MDPVPPPTHNRLYAGFDYATKLHDTVQRWTIDSPGLTLEDGSMRELARTANGPRAPRRKRPRRVAKKIARRGGYMRCRGLTQAHLKPWPAMRMWYGATS